MSKTFILLLFLWFAVTITAEAQQNGSAPEGCQFEIDQRLFCTPVKNQEQTGTCWSFSTASFLESEMVRNGMKETDLSDMFSVWHTYMKKAEKYMRYHGSSRLEEGSLAHDVLNVLREEGMVPESAYRGLPEGKTAYNHKALASELRAFLDAALKEVPVQVAWKDSVAEILNRHLSPLPQSFLFKGEHYTPVSFARQVVQLNPDTYFSLTSFQHHPYFERFILEVPDNFSNGYFYNIPLESLVALTKHALRNGFTVEWDGDVTEPGFSASKGMAVNPVVEWEKMSPEERDAAFLTPVKERQVTPEIRQDAFDKHLLTDDHLMHIVGLAHDQGGNSYFIFKNSWGTQNKGFDEGYVYVSESYFKRNTIAVTVHKDAIPPMLRKNLRI